MKFNKEQISQIWYTSDIHYSHKNICKGESQWADIDVSTRDFHNINEMNDTIIDNINEYVEENHHLFILGDLAFGNPYNVYELRKRINCKNIYVILGNHDKNIRDNKKIKIINGNIIYPIDLFSKVSNYMKISVDKIEIVLSHYAFRVWDGSHRGGINLFGHSHGSLFGIGKQMDVGVDNIYKLFGEYRPISHSEVIELMDNIELIKVDHH